MRNANKSPKIPYSAMVKKLKSNPESTCRSRSPAKVNHFLRVTLRPFLQSFFNVCFHGRQLFRL